MPIYEYQCKKCKHRFEKIQKFSDPPVRKCPECGGSVEKLVSKSAVQFKGSGWYVTDYARKSGSGDAGSSAGADSGASSSDTSSETASADAKPAEKSESKKAESKTGPKTESKTESKPSASKSKARNEK